MICFLSINTFSSFFLALNNNQNFIIPIFFIIWIIYFAKSKRVKRTFVQPDKKLSTIFFSILLLLIGGLTAIFDYEIREELKTGIEKNKTKENEILDKMSVLREETKKTKQAFATKILELKNEGNNEKELKNIFSKYKEDQKDYFKKVTPLFTEFKKTLSSSEVKQIEQMELLMKDFFTFEQNLLQEQIKCLEFWTDEPCLNLTKKWEDYEGKEEKFVQGIAKISGNKKLTVEKIYKDNLGEAIYEDLENFGTEIDDFHNLNDEGLNFYQKELYKEAINKFKEAINLNLETVSSADWATLYTNLSLAQQQLNLKEESKSSLEKALSFLEITNADYYVTKGELSLLNSNYDEAIINFKKALEIDPTNFSASNNLGIIYFDLDELGYEDYAKALSYNLIAYNSSADHNKLGVKKLLATF
ncbi:tetratricopeptide repeat protein [Candidatus Gracilibacteria bacterium]|nr:tetratricopeptide repeat protein [Candidatus Gracilibacteria bacterium]